MTKEAVQNLIKDSQYDEQLMVQLEAAEGSEAVLEIAKERGYEFTEEELISVMQEQQFDRDNEPVKINETAFNFVKEVSNNETWKEELEAINTPADIVRYAADKGYEFTEEDIISVMEHQQQLASKESELSEEALEAIAGGGEWECKVGGKLPKIRMPKIPNPFRRRRGKK